MLKMPRFSECWRCGNTVGVGIICELCGIAKYCSEQCQRNDIFRHEAECIPASILKTCTACRKSGPNLKACTGCYKAFYCDAKCQTSNWERHKIDCLEVKQALEATRQAVFMHHIMLTKLVPDACSYYYWGNLPAIDHLNLIENEGETYESELKMLYLGVGDLRNVALTCAMLPNSFGKKVSFTLNDRQSCVLARLVLLIYMLIRGNPEIAMEKAVAEIWYSIKLSKTTYECLRKMLEELLSFSSAKILKCKTLGLITIGEIEFKQLQTVWKCWLGLRVVGTTWIQKQRKKVVNETSELVERHAGYIGNVPTRHTNAAKKWIDDGIFKRTQGTMFAENPTLTGVDSTALHASNYSYNIDGGDFPFTGWDYVQVTKFKSSDCLVTMYGDYIECILRNFMKKLAKQQVRFLLVLCDCMKLKNNIEPGTVYDRILTSNLMDYLFLPSLLQLCSQMLNHDNQHATIITETMRWARDIMPEAGVFVPTFKELQLPNLTKLALADTKRSTFADDDGRSVIEYLDNSWEFNNFLRAMLCTYPLNPLHSVQKATPPTTKEFGNEFQLRLRDGVRNENRIAFFKLAVNRRRVNSIHGYERFLEWVPFKKKQTDGDKGRSSVNSHSKFGNRS